jgi:catechol 2,3-dioxygenase
MPLPAHVPAPPFNVVRCSHAVLRVRDLDASRRFYEEAIGLHVEDAGSDALYLRGMEERNHHSLVLKQGPEPVAERLGYKVASEADLDRALAFFRERQLPAELVEVPFQGRTLHATDTESNPLELYASMRQGERILQHYGRYRGCHPQRIDHFNLFARNVQASVEFYAALGFRITEYTESEEAEPKIAACWMHRKGTVHDVAFTSGRGPRLHHFAYWVPGVLNVIHLCDVLATTGWLPNMERGPGRHGLANAFFLYVRDPDGHRIELYASDYLTVDPDLTPIRWSLRDPRRQTLWGTPAPRSWFEEGTPFPGTPVEPPLHQFNPVMAD